MKTTILILLCFVLFCCNSLTEKKHNLTIDQIMIIYRAGYRQGMYNGLIFCNDGDKKSSQLQWKKDSLTILNILNQ